MTSERTQDATPNPAAFPLQRGPHCNEGMSLLDYFAGQALAGLCVNFSDGAYYDHTAETAYRQAAAMIIARAKGNSHE